MKIERKEGISSRCMECDDVITNPLCAHCLAEKMRMVVGITNKTLAKNIVGFSSEGSTTCLQCGDHMALCAHCFSKDIYEYVQENDPQLAKDFIRHFDFDLRRNFSVA